MRAVCIGIVSFLINLTGALEETELHFHVFKRQSWTRIKTDFSIQEVTK